MLVIKANYTCPFILCRTTYKTGQIYLYIYTWSKNTNALIRYNCIANKNLHKTAVINIENELKYSVHVPPKSYSMTTLFLIFYVKIVSHPLSIFV